MRDARQQMSSEWKGEMEECRTTEQIDAKIFISHVERTQSQDS